MLMPSSIPCLTHQFTAWRRPTHETHKARIYWQTLMLISENRSLSHKRSIVRIAQLLTVPYLEVYRVVEGLRNAGLVHLWDDTQADYHSARFVPQSFASGPLPWHKHLTWLLSEWLRERKQSQAVPVMKQPRRAYG